MFVSYVRGRTLVFNPVEKMQKIGRGVEERVPLRHKLKHGSLIVCGRIWIFYSRGNSKVVFVELVINNTNMHTDYKMQQTEKWAWLL